MTSPEGAAPDAPDPRVSPATPCRPQRTARLDQGRGWLLVCALLIACTVTTRPLPATWLDWQPQLVWHQPWRAWSAAWVHLSATHFWANLGATALVGAYGWAAQVPGRSALAWLVAWPLGHLLLGLNPELLHYGGLSGLMHAGVAVVNTYLIACGSRAERAVGGAMAVMLLAKVLSETPWQQAVQHSAEWDIPLAPLGHATGLIAGLLCSAAVELIQWRARRRLG